MMNQQMQATIFVIHVRLKWMQQLYEELQDHMQEEAAQAARIIYSNVIQRRQEGVFWLLLKKDQAVPFANRLSSMLAHDEDILAYQEVSLSLFQEQIERFYRETETPHT